MAVRALLVVGGVHVDVQRLAAGRRDPGLDLLDMGEGGPEIEVDPDDPVAARREGQRRRLAHPARGAEDERPALAVVGHGCLRLVVMESGAAEWAAGRV